MDFQEIADGDGWELFARDLFAAVGLVVEVPPGRGADGGRDLLVSEQLRGSLASRKFTWLVSCKHHAHSGRAVGSDDEPSIADRLRQHRADGFLGFYSTMASSGLVERLRALADPRPGEAVSIQRFEIFDNAKITARFHTAGLAPVAPQHLPVSYARLRPVHALGDAYEPLPCEVCGRDVLLADLAKPYSGAILFARSRAVGPSGQKVSVHVVCKGKCDRTLEDRLWAAGFICAWDDVGDYCNPLYYLRRLTGYVNTMRAERDSYTDAAHEAYLRIVVAVSQRTLRQPTAEDRERFMQAIGVEGL